jgi:putative acetyltransferase
MDLSSNDGEIVITAENPHSEVGLSLIAQLTSELSVRYGDDGGADAFKPDDVLVPGGAFLVARVARQPVGCGAIRPLDSGVGEVKRMFVKPEARGKGIARRMLIELESAARRLGYNSLRLETGLMQPEAISLYESAGYRRVACYGQYVDNPMSVCFEKTLV